MAVTAIEWTDSVWNCLVGCFKVSPGCAKCYAERMAKRLRAIAEALIAQGKDPGYLRYYIETVDDRGRWTGKVLLIPEKLQEPLRWKKPRRVFVNSMSDLFHEDVPTAFIDQVFAVMALCPQHTFQVLTKRAERMAAYLMDEEAKYRITQAMCHIEPDCYTRLGGRVFDVQRDEDGGLDAYEVFFPLENAWMGVSVEDQKTAEERIPPMARAAAEWRFTFFLSCEPMLGTIDLGKWLSVKFPLVNWVICGGESGPRARPMHPDWARTLRNQCVAADVPFFFKQWGETAPVLDANWKRQGVGWMEPDSQIYSIGEEGNVSRVWLQRVGKKAAGRVLDGRTWDEYPQVTR